MLRVLINLLLLVVLAMHGLSLCHVPTPCPTSSAGSSAAECHELVCGAGCGCRELNCEEGCEVAVCGDWQWPAGGGRVIVEVPVLALPVEALVVEGVRGRDWDWVGDLRVGSVAPVGVGCGLPLLF